MYADDTVIYIWAKNSEQAALKLTNIMVHVTKWLTDSCLHLNVKKTVCMFFSKTKRPDPVSSVQVSGTTLEVVSSYKYLGIILDSQLSFKKQV